MNFKKTLILAACIATSITAAALAYEQAIVVIYGRHLPKAWAIDLSNLTLGEIYQQIGPPQENLAAKGYQNWVVYHWWGAASVENGTGRLWSAHKQANGYLLHGLCQQLV